MRTKTLLLTAALSAVSAAAAMAQTVYSVNAVGYVNVTIPAGQFMLLANPLDAGTNSLSNVLPDAPNGTTVYKFNGSGYSTASKNFGAWGGANTMTLNPGEGFFVKNGTATDLKLTFVGEVVQGTAVTMAIPNGFSMLGSPIPQAGKLKTDLQLPVKNGQSVYLFNGTGYETHSFNFGTWSGGEPSIGVAQGFWFNSGATGATNWVRNFTVNQ
jgi:hypothetical protein